MVFHLIDNRNSYFGIIAFDTNYGNLTNNERSPYFRELIKIQIVGGRVTTAAATKHIIVEDY